MTQQDEIVARLHASAPALLSGDPDAIEQAEMDISDWDFHGLALIASPTQPAGAPLPVALLVQKSALRGWEVPEEANLALTAYEPATGTLRIANLLRDRKTLEYPPPDLVRPPRPPESERRTIMTKVYRLDAREHLDLPDSSDRLLLRAVAFNWVSNSAIIRIEGPARTAAPAKLHPHPAVTRGALPSYESSSHHPPTAAQGIALKVERLGDGGTALLGSFAKVVTTGDLLPEPLQVITGSGPQQAVAALRAALLVVGLDLARPIVATLGVPLFGSAAPAVGQRVEGRFAFDLQQLGAANQPGRYAVYLFVDDQVYGPLEFEI